jgi:hypothetical protein
MTGRHGEVLVVLNVLPALEDRLTDWLLGRQDRGFTRSPVAWMGAGHDELSAAEQVTGYQRRLHFSVQMPLADADAFLDALEDSFGAADLRYSVLPVIRSGSFRRGRSEKPDSGGPTAG